MRISSNLLYNQFLRGLNDNSSKLTDISNQLATGKKINKPSDDVLGTSQVLDYKLSISQNDQYESNIAQANNYLDFSDTVLSQVSDTLGSLKNLISEGGGTSGSTENRASYSSQTANLRDFLLDLSNSTYLNKYVFSGFQTDQQAYVYDSTNNQYVYQGDSGQLKLSIDKRMTQTINFVGSSDDSNIATAFSYTLKAPETTTLSDGSLVTYTAVPNSSRGDTNIQVNITNPDHPGDPNYEDSFNFSNFMDLANTLSHAWQYQDVGGSALSESKSMNRIAALAIPLGKAQNQVLTVQSEVGIRQASLNDQKTRLNANTVIFQNAQSQTEDANMDETIMDLQKISTVLEALRMSSSKVLSKSLFDFLASP
jgi:flagellar hook-associated protein 3 FlgL